MYEHPEIGNPNIQFNQLGMSGLEGHVIFPELLARLESGLDKHMIETNNPRAIKLSSPFFFLKIGYIEIHAFHHHHIGQ